MRAGLVVVAWLVSCAAPAQRGTDPPQPTRADPWAARGQAQPPQPQPQPQPPEQPQAQPQPQPQPPQQAQPKPKPQHPVKPTLAGCPSDLPTPAKSEVPLADVLHVWRSRDALPECLRPHVPADFDFAREMLAASTPRTGAPVVIAAPYLPLVRAKRRIIIEQHAPPHECPICRGIAEDDRLNRLNKGPAEPPPLTLWRLPRVNNVDVYVRLKHTATSPALCPPCLAS